MREKITSLGWQRSKIKFNTTIQKYLTAGWCHWPINIVNWGFLHAMVLLETTYSTFKIFHWPDELLLTVSITLWLCKKNATHSKKYQRTIGKKKKQTQWQQLTTTTKKPNSFSTIWKDSVLTCFYENRHIKERNILILETIWLDKNMDKAYYSVRESGF